MPLWECPVCHGTYRDPQFDVVPYYHVCPPLSVPELLARPRGAVLAVAPELGSTFTRSDLERLALVRAIERPGARNELLKQGQGAILVGPGPHQPPPEPERIQDRPPRILRGP